MTVQPSEYMGDPRHKKPPPPDKEEEVTPEFRETAKRILANNAESNTLRRLKKGEPGYLISNRAELADAVGTDKTMINKIIGPARPTSKVKLVDTSAFVGRIRDALRMPSVTRISVKASRADVIRLLDELPDDRFAAYAEALRSSKRP